MVSVDTLVAVSVDGVAFGMVLALLGVGITLVYGLGEVLNLAIGTFAVVTVLLATVVGEYGFGLLVASVASLLAIAVLGYVVDQVLLSLVYRSDGEERVLVGIFTTLGLSVFLGGALVNFYPSQYRLQLELGLVPVGGAAVVGNSLLSIAVAALVLGVLVVFLRRTYVGKSTRTVFQDERGAMLVGIDPRRVRTLVFVLSVVVAGVAGLLTAVSSPVSVASGFRLTTLALIVSIIGGVRSISGTIAAGLLLGMVDQFANFFVGSYVTSIVLYMTVVVALLVRPEVTST